MSEIDSIGSHIGNGGDFDPLDGRDKLELCAHCEAPGYLMNVGARFKVKCTGCQMQTALSLYRNEVIAAWNRRALSSRPDTGEAVAWLYEKGASAITSLERRPDNVEDGWTETALYAHPPVADRLKYEGDVIDAVQRLIEQGRATVDSEGYLVAYPPAAVGDYRELIAYNIIHGSAGIRAAEHAKDFKTSNWMDALRSADAVISAIFPQPAAPHPTDAQRIVEWLREDAARTAGDLRRLHADKRLTPSQTVQWENMIQLKAGIATAIERGEHLKGGRDE